MLSQFVKHTLDYKKAIVYVRDQLPAEYPLSKELNTLDFEKGQFFCFLPKDANVNEIYNFFDGLILPQDETQTHEAIGEVKGYYTCFPPITKDDLSILVSEKIKYGNNYVGVFEDVQQELTDPHIEFYHQFGFSCLNKMYYFLSKKDASPELIYTAIREVNAIWHQLFIITEVNPIFINQFKPGQEVTENIFKEFAANIRLLVLGAYDGEGYFFWEPNKTSDFR